MILSNHPVKFQPSRAEGVDGDRLVVRIKLSFLGPKYFRIYLAMNEKYFL